MHATQLLPPLLPPAVPPLLLPLATVPLLLPGVVPLPASSFENSWFALSPEHAKNPQPATATSAASRMM
jgi:hypothetical protein